MRGDIITKVEDYDARDLRHEDAQLLFRTQDNKIRLVVRRDNKIAMNSSKSNPISSLPPPNIMPTYVPTHHPNVPYRYVSSIGFEGFATKQLIFSVFRAALPNSRGPLSLNPIDSLPHTVFPNDYQQQYTPYQQVQQEQHVNFPPIPPPRSCFSPQLSRDPYQTSNDDENAAIQNQVSSSPLLNQTNSQTFSKHKTTTCPN